MWNASRFCVSSLRRGHANLLCIVPILVYVLPKQVRLLVFVPLISSGGKRRRRWRCAGGTQGRRWCRGLAVEKLEQEEVEMYEERAGGGRGEEEEKAGRQGERRGRFDEEVDEEKGMNEVKGCWWGRRGWKENAFAVGIGGRHGSALNNRQQTENIQRPETATESTNAADNQHIKRQRS
ncbi:unnamed protein product, partial [Heterotrigona itama]